MPISEALQTTVIDYTILDEMRDLLEDEFDELVEEYKEDSQQMLEQLTRAVESSSLEQITTLCHTLSSSSAHMGFLQLAQVAKAIENMAREQSQQDYAELSTQLQQCYQQLLTQLG